MVNVISWISILAISVVGAAMFVVLSGFNGIEQIVKKTYSEFDAELKIVHENKKFFEVSDSLTHLFSLPKIEGYSEVLEDKCLYVADGKKQLGTLKGVDKNFINTSLLPTKLIDGKFVDFENKFANIVLGESLRIKLGVGIGNTYSQVESWTPRPNKKPSLDFTKDFKSQKYFTIGSFSISPEYDPYYGICNIEYARKVTGLDHSVSSIELKIKNSEDIPDVHDILEKQLAPYNLKILTIEEQHADFLKFVNLEKGFVVFIFILIILLAAFNLIGSLTILVIEKDKDLRTLLHLGLNLNDVRKIFWNLNYMMNGIGLLLGLIIGYIICYLQQEYELLLMGNGNIGIPYPVDVQFMDIFILIFLVFIISTICSSFSIRKIKVNTL